jgi:hypothetical protein
LLPLKQWTLGKPLAQNLKITMPFSLSQASASPGGTMETENWSPHFRIAGATTLGNPDVSRFEISKISPGFESKRRDR